MRITISAGVCFGEDVLCTKLSGCFSLYADNGDNDDTDVMEIIISSELLGKEEERE